MEFTEFWTILSSNNIILNIKQIEQFKRFLKEIDYWNTKINLISRQDEQNIIERHFLHSLSVLKYINIPTKARCLDFGTGGGFPGIPIKIAKPDIFMTLCDSITKKLKMAEMFALHTELRNFYFEYGRVENLKNKDKYIGHFDCIFARAVAKAIILIDWTLPLLKKDGKFIFYKGGDLDEEIKDIKIKYPKLSVNEIKIDLFGAPWFKTENKKILIIKNIL